MFSANPNLKHIVIANIVSGGVSLVMVGAVLYSWISQSFNTTPAMLISYVGMVMAWIFLFTKVHRAIDINARRVSFKKHLINSAATAGAATAVFIFAWLASLYGMSTLSSVVLMVGLIITAVIQILLYVAALRESSDLTTVIIK